MDQDDFAMLAFEIASMPAITTFLGRTLPAVPYEMLSGYGGESVDAYDSKIRREVGSLFKAILELPKAEREMFIKPFNGMLNELLSNDFFGTEGQCDPRGDHRN